MFTAGWAGLSAGWLGRISKWVRGRMGEGASQRGGESRFTFHVSRFKFHVSRITQYASRLEIFVLCIFGFIWGLLYGAIMNIYFWPFAVGSAEQTWAPGIGLGETLARYGAFYVVTSLAWDLARAAGNVALILILGAPMIKALERFRRRFHFEVGGVGQETAPVKNVKDPSREPMGRPVPAGGKDA